MAALLTLPAGPCTRADRLWLHTCFEAFVSAAGQSAYREFNFAPDGRWAAYAFSAYREAAPESAPDFNPTCLPAPEIAVQRAPDRLRLTAVLKPEALPPALRGAALEIGLSAVIEPLDAATHAPQLSYWALHHPAGRPDFHDRRAFALKLAPVATSPENTTP